MNKILGMMLAMMASAGAMADGVDNMFTTEAPQQEKVYLHLDNNWYFTGDSIFYKAYVVDAATHRPTDLSRVLYVELLNEQGYLVERQMVAVGISGHSQGAFGIPHDGFAGYYEVRAYTKWMMNFGWEGVGRYPWKEWEKKTIAANNKPSWQTNYDTHALRKRISDEKRKNDGFVDMDQHNERLETTMRDASFFDNNKRMSEMEDRAIDKWNEDASWEKDDRYDMDNGLSDYLNGLSVFPDAQSKRYRVYDGLFSRILPVYQRPDSAQNYRRKVMPLKVTTGDYNKVYNGKKFNFNFYPEGGHLVEGHLSRIGWEARDDEGRRMNVKGVLLEDDEVIDSIKPVHAGRGDFRFLPRPGHKYKVKIECGDKTYTPDLPKVEKMGCTLFVDRRGDDITLQVGKTLPDQRTLYLSLLSGGKALGVYSLDFANGDAMVKVPTKELPAGVIQATIFDSTERILSDRLFFVDNFDSAVQRATVKGKMHDAEPYEKVTLSVNIADKDGFPVQGQTISVSVRDGGQMDESFYNGNILSELLLQSELRGFVENPDYYFRKTNGIDEAQRRHALDNLMLIQGWRRYDWTDIAHADKWEPEYNAEHVPSITGEVAVIRHGLLKNNKKRPIKVFCGIRAVDSETGEIDLKTTYQPCDSLGRFSLPYNPYYGNSTITLRAQYGDYKKERSQQEHDGTLFIKRDHFFPKFVRPLDWFEINKPDFMFGDAEAWKRYEDEAYEGRLLDNVTVTARNKQPISKRLDKPVMKVDALEIINTIWDMGYYDSFYKTDNDGFDIKPFTHNLESLFTGRFWTRDRGIPEYRWNGHAVMSSFDEYDRWSRAYQYWGALDSIAVVSDEPLRASPFYLHHLTANKNGAVINKYILIEAHTMSEAGWQGRLYRERGFCEPVEFYSPDYSKIALPETPDTRHTLYWAPNIVTDANGRARITFYNNGVCKDFDVDVQGVTKDGKFIVR